MSEYYLGLDISTSCTGWCIGKFSESEPVSVEMGAIKLDSADDLIGKAHIVREEILRLSKEFSINRVYIEENMQAFRPGASSAQTLVKLAKFNGIVMFLCHQVTGITPISVNVNKARKTLGINLQREKVCGIPTKVQIHQWALSHKLLRDYKWPSKKIASGPRKGSEVLDTSAYDMADAFVICMSGPIVAE